MDFDIVSLTMLSHKKPNELTHSVLCYISFQ